MRHMISIITVTAAILLACPAAHTADSGDGSQFKFSFDPFSLLGGSDRSCEEAPDRVDDRTDSEKFTYDAMGRKVPVRTETDGNILH